MVEIWLNLLGPLTNMFKDILLPVACCLLPVALPLILSAAMRYHGLGSDSQTAVRRLSRTLAACRA